MSFCFIFACHVAWDIDLETFQVDEDEFYKHCEDHGYFRLYTIMRNDYSPFFSVHYYPISTPEDIY